MADLTDLLQSQLTGSILESLTSNLGAKNQRQTQSAANGAVSVLLNALARNAASPQGATALGAALDRDHDGSILDDLAGMIAGTANVSNPRTLNGAGILKHILKGRQSGAAGTISKMSGLNSNQSLNMLIKLAPLVLGALGKMKRSNNIDTRGLPDVLSGAARKMNKSQSNSGLIESFLDADGDGNLSNKVKKVGFSFLRLLLGGRRR